MFLCLTHNQHYVIRFLVYNKIFEKKNSTQIYQLCISSHWFSNTNHRVIYVIYNSKNSVTHLVQFDCVVWLRPLISRCVFECVTIMCVVIDLQQLYFHRKNGHTHTQKNVICSLCHDTTCRWMSMFMYHETLDCDSRRMFNYANYLRPKI